MLVRKLYISLCGCDIHTDRQTSDAIKVHFFFLRYGTEKEGKNFLDVISTVDVVDLVLEI